MLDLIIAILLAAVFSVSLFVLLDWLGKKTETRLKSMLGKRINLKNEKNHETKKSKTDQKDSRSSNSRR
jgi:hypothetical protein